ncbi:MAG: 50S ribosomal protein L10 [Pseudomonadota bacterium]
MNRQEKEQKVEHWHEVFGKVQGAVFTGVSGLTVAQSTELRKRFRAAQVSYVVVKNTLARLALKDTEMEVATHLLDGPTAIGWSNTDPAGPARVAADFTKETDKFEIRGAYATGKAVDKAGAMALATMPTFEELRAQLLGIINGVAGKLLAQVNAPASNLIGVLQARKEDLEKTAA